MSQGVDVQELSVHFDDRLILDRLSLRVDPGQFITLIGPSGSGKSTLFGVLTGTVAPTAGQVTVAGEPIVGRQVDRMRRPFAYMPQQDALMPWRRLLDNLTLGLEMQGVRRRAARDRVRPLLAPFGLAGFERAYPWELSGGMRQRAALLRTIVQQRAVLLLDEPFGALDALTRLEMQQWLERVWDDHRWTVLLITHDIREAVLLSDQVFVLSARPARVIGSVAIDLHRPRSLDMLADPQFVALESRLLSLLRDGPPTAEPANRSR